MTLFRACKTALIAAAVTACGVSDPKSGIRVSIEAPPEVPSGAAFEFVAQIHNEGKQAAELDSIDIGDSYLEHIRLVSSDPPWTEHYHVPIDNTESHSYGLAIAPGGTLVVRFAARAGDPAQASGDFDICVNSAVNCFFERIETRIVAP
jgi:hypothetical protein